MDNLEYASGYERMYGVTDERYEYLRLLQRQLSRFDTAPIWPSADAGLLERLDEQRGILARSGFDPTVEDNVFEAVKTDFVHTTARIEGNTLSLKETGLVLEENATIPGKPLSEHLEIIDIGSAFDLMVRFVREQRELSADLICSLHKEASAHLDDCEPGEYRWDQRYVSSSPILPPPPNRVHALMESLIEWSLAAGNSIATASLFHLVFEDIHPFQDGNGRTGRIVLNFMLMSAGFPPISMKADPQGVEAYYRAIDSFVRDTEHRDGSAMVDLVAHRLEDSVGRRMVQLDQQRTRPR